MKSRLTNLSVVVQMVVWVLVSLLPLVLGDRPGFQEDPKDAEGLITAILEEQPFDSLPEEEDMGDGDDHFLWHIYGKFANGLSFILIWYGPIVRSCRTCGLVGWSGGKL